MAYGWLRGVAVSIQRLHAIRLLVEAKRVRGRVRLPGEPAGPPLHPGEPPLRSARSPGATPRSGAEPVHHTASRRPAPSVFAGLELRQATLGVVAIEDAHQPTARDCDDRGRDPSLLQARHG